MVPDYGSFAGQKWFIEKVAGRPDVRAVFSGHIHRNGLYVAYRAPRSDGPAVAGELMVRGLLEWQVAGAKAPRVSNLPHGSSGPLFVNTTSAGPRGNFKRRSETEPERDRGGLSVDPGYAKLDLAADGSIERVVFGFIATGIRAAERSTEALESIGDSLEDGAEIYLDDEMEFADEMAFENMGEPDTADPAGWIRDTEADWRRGGESPVGSRLNELSRFLDHEFDPSSRTDELPRAVALLLEANPFPDEPMSGEFDGSAWTPASQEATGPGNRIPRAVVADDLGNGILDLLWEPIEESDVPRMRRRLAALHRVFDEIPSGPAACTLLNRLSAGGDLLADFDYRLSRKSAGRPSSGSPRSLRPDPSTGPAGPARSGRDSRGPPGRIRSRIRPRRRTYPDRSGQTGAPVAGNHR